jgi:hypothetical protein
MGPCLRRDDSEIFNCQTALHLNHRRTSSPLFFVRPGAAGRLLLSVSRKGVRNAWAFHRTRGPVCKRGRKNAHELLPDADPRLRSARNGFCGLLNAPGRRRTRRLRPVRASCRPGTHLDRSPVLPASVPSRHLGALPLASKDRHRGGHRIPLRTRKTVRTRPHIGAGRSKEYSYHLGKSISETTKIEEACWRICCKLGNVLMLIGKTGQPAASATRTARALSPPGKDYRPMPNRTPAFARPPPRPIGVPSARQQAEPDMVPSS